MNRLITPAPVILFLLLRTVRIARERSRAIDALWIEGKRRASVLVFSRRRAECGCRSLLQKPFNPAEGWEFLPLFSLSRKQIIFIPRIEQVDNDCWTFTDGSAAFRRRKDYQLILFAMR